MKTIKNVFRTKTFEINKMLNRETNKTYRCEKL